MEKEGVDPDYFPDKSLPNGEYEEEAKPCRGLLKKL